MVTVNQRGVFPAVPQLITEFTVNSLPSELVNWSLSDMTWHCHCITDVWRTFILSSCMIFEHFMNYLGVKSSQITQCLYHRLFMVRMWVCTLWHYVHHTFTPRIHHMYFRTTRLFWSGAVPLWLCPSPWQDTLSFL